MTHLRARRTLLPVFCTLCLALCLGLISCRMAGRVMAGGAETGPVAAPQQPAAPEQSLEQIAAHAGLAWPLKSAHMVVDKKERTLSLYSGDTLLKTYPVAFGSHPRGPKSREGDSRTPEGTYELFKHNSPSFGKCFYIGYPNLDDARRGLDAGRITRSQYNQIKKQITAHARPPANTGLGGLILLHGTKDRSQSGLTDTDWTLGCIAMENAHILELLDAVADSARPTLTVQPWPQD